MNLEPYNLNYQDGLNTYPIIDYIDIKIAESSGNIIVSGGASGDTLNNYIYLSSNSNLIINNANQYGIINFKTLYNYYNGITNGTYINYDGRLYVYHNYKITQPLVASGYLNVEDELAGLKQSTMVADAEMVIVQAEIAGINSSLIIQEADITKIETTVELHTQIISTLVDYEYYETIFYDNLANSLSGATALSDAVVAFIRRKNIIEGVLGGVSLVVLTTFIASIYEMNELDSLKSFYSNANSNVLNNNERTPALSNINVAQSNNYINIGVNLSNLCVYQGFINSNIITDQFIPTLKSNKIMIGNITTPNVAYQMELTGDLNLNMLYLNSTSLSSLLNQKQGNLTFTQPLYNTTNTIGLNYDASLTKVGNNLSVVKTATTPIVITGNDFSLNYDASLTKISGNLSVVKTASLPLVITGNNWTLNYDSTLELSGNNLKVAAATGSKWTTSGTHIYNNNTGNVGINTNNPSYKLHIEDGSLFIGDSAVGNGSQTDNGYRLVFDSSYTTTGANKCNKILLHKNDTAPTYVAGFGIEAGALAYSVWTGGNHNFYTSTTTTSGGFLSFSIYRDNFRNYGSVNGGAGGVISNGNNGTSAYSYLSLANDTGNGILFLNSSTKTTDGGANTLTLRNDVTGGDLRLSANLDSPYIYLKKSNGRVGISHNNPTSRFTIKATYDDADSGLCLDAGDDGANNKYNFKIYPYVVGGGQVGYKFRIVNNISTTIDPIVIRHDGITTFAYNTYFNGITYKSVNNWHLSTDGYKRFYFANTSRTYFGSGSGYEWRSPTDTGIAVMSVIGQLGLQNLEPIGTFSLGNSAVNGSDGSMVIHKRNSDGSGTRHMKMGFYTFTFDLAIGDFGNNNVPGSWIKAFWISWQAPNNTLCLQASGVVYAAYGYSSGSDIKLKTDIKTIDNALWKVEQLRGVEYTLISNQQRNIGLIAQEVEGIVPEVVGYNQDTDTKTINYNGMIGLLVEAIKQQQEQINNLNNRIRILENK